MPSPHHEQNAIDTDAPVPGRAEPHKAIALQRLKASWVLRAAAVLAFLGYGGLIALVLAEKLPFQLAGTIALLSLGSWFFLFWWYPVMQRTFESLGRDERRRRIGGMLEGVAIFCVVLVHVLMAVIVVYSARS